jgi:hypothetical protein
MPDKEALIEILERKLRRMFPDDTDHGNALDLLHDYGKEPYHKEPERVRLDILKLAGADMDELKKYLKVAMQDYRDILAWAEYPEQMKDPTYKMDKEIVKEIMARDRAQYDKWLKSD